MRSGVVVQDVGQTSRLSRRCKRGPECSRLRDDHGEVLGIKIVGERVLLDTPPAPVTDHHRPLPR